MVALLLSSLKSFLRLSFVSAFALLVFFQSPYSAGEEPNDLYFSGKQQGAANTVFELPVQLVPVLVSGSAVPQTKTWVRSTQKSSCEIQPELCEKIKFTGKFTEGEKKRYQKLIMVQILSIDKILTTSSKLNEVLFTITLAKGKGNRRARAGSDTILINLGGIGTEKEFLEVLTHELAHIIDLKILTKGSIPSLFNDPSLDFYEISRESENTRKADAVYMSFVGGYAMSDPYEDFAESFNLYINHYSVFTLLATSNDELKEKYEYMKNLLGKKYLKADTTSAVTLKNDLEQRVRDTTKGY